MYADLEFYMNLHLRSLYRWIIGVCLIIAPLGAVIVTLAHPKTVNDGASQLAIIAPNPSQWIIVHNLLFADVVLMVPMILGLWYILQRSKPVLALVAGSFTMLGLIGGIGSATDELIVGQMAQMPTAQTQMAMLFDQIHGGGGFFVFVLAWLFPLGLLLFAWGLYQEKILPSWVAALLALGAAGEFIGLPTATPLLSMAGHSLEFLALGWLGLQLLSVKRVVISKPA
jgi:hypothetical protein